VKAVWHAVHGGPEVLQLVDLPDPVPDPHQVVVEVRAAGLNRLDILQRSGPPLLPGFRLPHVPGMDITGVVAATGSSVEGVETGTRVVVKPGIHCGRCDWCSRGHDRLCTSVQVTGGTSPGGYAEYCVVPASHVFALPEGVSFEEAATIPTAVSTAWRALVQTAQVRAGDFVVIHGPGSGVSVAAVQIAKHAGATVIVTGRSDGKLRRALEVGADHVVNEAAPDLVDEVKSLCAGCGADVVLNRVGPALFDLSIQLLRPDGRLVHCGTTTGTAVTLHLPYLYHAGIQILGVGPQGYADFAAMLERCWNERYVAVIDSCFPLEHAADAQVRLDSGEVFGKVLLCP
jgi:NADPH:quinone reductase-like Zn-dependent oxidoreductase